MSFSTIKRHRLRRILVPAFAAAYLGYFGFHAFHGTYGIWAKADFEAQAATLEVQLSDLQEQTGDYERRNALLRPQSLDPDMIDERARQSLNVIGPDDVVVIP